MKMVEFWDETNIIEKIIENGFANGGFAIFDKEKPNRVFFDMRFVDEFHQIPTIARR